MFNNKCQFFNKHFSKHFINNISFEVISESDNLMNNGKINEANKIVYLANSLSLS